MPFNRRIRLRALRVSVSSCLFPAAVLCALGSSAHSAPSRLDPAKLKRIDSAAAAVLKEGHVPGAVVFAGAGDRVDFRGVYGSRRLLPAAEPMTAGTIFDMASCSKVLGTTAALMCLVEDGKIALDDPVAKHVPGFGVKGKDRITIRDLVTHVSGLPAYTSAADLRKENGAGPNPDAVIAKIAGMDLQYPTGSKVVYACLNMITAARVIENVAGKSLHALLTERVYGPLGMRDSGYHPTREQRLRIAPTTRTDDPSATNGAPPGGPAGEFIVGAPHDPLANYGTNDAHCSGNAGLFSTAADISVFLRMILNRGEYRGVRIYKPETVDLFTRVQTKAGIETRGLGWDVWNDYPFQPKADLPEGKQAVGHTGYTGTLIWIDKSAGLWATILTNRVHPDDSKESSRAVSRLREGVIRAVVEASDAYGPKADAPAGR